jgi:thiamine biosynthesis protein ThiI
MNKVICLISGGIDSAVACYMMMERGVEVVLLHYDNWPYSDKKNLIKVRKLAKKLKGFYKKRLKLYLIPHGKNQTEIMKKCKRKLTCVLCRRFMYRIAEQIAEKENASAIVTGESLGQVASQTLVNLRVEKQAVKISILRPLLGLDKEEIVNKAKQIGTYEISILPGLCCVAVPKKPATKARLKEVLEEEDKMRVSSLVRSSIEKATLDWVK